MQAVPLTKKSRVAPIFGRLFETNKEPVSEELARFFARLTFSKHDKARMHELAEKNREAFLTPEEAEELDAYILAGDLLTMFQLETRRALRKSKTGKTRHG
jgi:hypothetical protein